MEWVIFLLGLILGAALGVGITRVTSRTKPIGTLRIDTSDPDGPYLFLELNKGIGEFYTQDYVMLEVSNESYISRK